MTLALAGAGPVAAATLDPTFGDGGIAAYDLSDPQERIIDTVEAPDGDILALLNQDDSSYPALRSIVRFEPDGSVSQVIDRLPRGELPGTAGALSGMNAIHLDDAGRIYVTGTRSVPGPPALRAYGFALRLTPNGDVDETFGADGVARVNPGYSSFTLAEDSAMASDRMYLAGTANFVGGGRDILLACLDLESGEPCAGFGSNGRARVSFRDGFDPESAEAVDVDSQGRIVAAATVTASGHDDLALLRFGPTGELDPSFAGNGVRLVDPALNHPQVAVDVDSLDRIAVASSSYYDRPAIVERYSEGGDLDGFGRVATPGNGQLRDLEATGNRLTLAWELSDSGPGPDGPRLSRWTAGGEADLGWGEAGTVAPTLGTGEPVEAWSVASIAQGRTLVAGSIKRSLFRGDEDTALIVLDPEGDREPLGTETTSPLSGEEKVFDLAPSGSGYLAVTGPVAGRHRALARFTGEGELDQSFGDGGIGARQGPSFFYKRVAEDAEGRLVVIHKGLQDRHTVVSRLTADGEIDPGFQELDLGFEDGASLTPAGDDVFVRTSRALIRIESDETSTLYEGGASSRCYYPRQVLIDSRGRALLACAVKAGVRIVRFTADGELDGRFGKGGKVLIKKPFVSTKSVVMAIGRNDAPVVAFSSHDEKLRLARLGRDGHVRRITSHRGRGEGIFRIVSLEIDSEGRLYLIRVAERDADSTLNTRVIRFQRSGALDRTYGGPRGFKVEGFDVVMRPDITAEGVVTLGGTVSTDGGDTDTGLARIVP